MTTLSDARPEDLLRCGAVLGQVAEQVALVGARTRRTTGCTWRGRAGSEYDDQLAWIGHRLDAVERAYDQACDVLVAYSRELAHARELAVLADALDQRAATDRAAELWVGGLASSLAGDAEASSGRAERLRAEAVELEAVAARRTAVVLDQLVGEAPRSKPGGRALRAVDDTVRGFVGGVAGGIAGLGAMAWDAMTAVPGVGSAHSRRAHRDDLVQQAEGLVQPWLAVEQFLAQWRAHHRGAAIGELGAGLLMRRTHAGSKEGARFGFLDDMHEPVLRAVYRGGRADTAMDEAWLLERAQQRWDADIERLRHLPPATVEHLVEGSVDLIHSEALGGHVIRKHIGRDWEFLRARQAANARFANDLPPMSVFHDLAEAQAAISLALQANRSQILAFVETSDAVLRVATKVERRVGDVLGSDGVPWLGDRYAWVELRRTADGGVYVHTAFLSLKPVKTR